MANSSSQPPTRHITSTATHSMSALNCYMTFWGTRPLAVSKLLLHTSRTVLLLRTHSNVCPAANHRFRAQSMVLVNQSKYQRRRFPEYSRCLAVTLRPKSQHLERTGKADATDNMFFTQSHGFVVEASLGLLRSFAPLSRVGLPRRGHRLFGNVVSFW